MRSYNLACAVLICILGTCVANTDIKFDFKGLLSGAPTGCQCGNAPTDCSQCLTGINGWLCRPRDCTFCSHGINGFPCGGTNCSTCQFGINGWPCQKAASVTICSLSFTDPTTNWTGAARYEVTQQQDVAWAKLYVSSSLPLLGIQLRQTDNQVAWQVYPVTAGQVGQLISWARLPALSSYTFPNSNIALGYSASLAAYSPASGRRAPDYLIPAQSVGLYLWMQLANATDYAPAPSAGNNAMTCTTATNFQQDAINALNTGTNFR